MAEMYGTVHVRRGAVHDRERAHGPLIREPAGTEVLLAAPGARVAPVEVQGAAGLAFLRDQVGLVAELQIADVRQLTGHPGS